MCLWVCVAVTLRKTELECVLVLKDNDNRKPLKKNTPKMHKWCLHHLESTLRLLSDMNLSMDLISSRSLSSPYFISSPFLYFPHHLFLCFSPPFISSPFYTRLSFLSLFPLLLFLFLSIYYIFFLFLLSSNLLYSFSPFPSPLFSSFSPFYFPFPFFV